MKINKGLLVGILALAATSAQAAVKDHSVKYRLAINEDGRLIHESKRQSYGFRVEIVSDNDGVKTEASKNGRPFITASKGERYSVRLYNPLPVRVAVNLTVDGLNSISGKPSGISDGQKWVIDAYSSVTIPGWQVSGGEARRFFFTDKPKSYAKWTGDRMGKDLSANCGVIGAAYFWDQRELDRYYDNNPLYRTTQRPYYYNGCGDTLSQRKAESRASGAGAPACAPSMDRDAAMDEVKEKEVAGTGMGERESHPTYEVSFDYNKGMYSADQAVVIYYDFAPVVSPNPFPNVSFAPEMP